jgi:hypothetical protein
VSSVANHPDRRAVSVDIAFEKDHGLHLHPAGGHGRMPDKGEPGLGQFDSIGPWVTARRLTSVAASVARLRSEYLARGAEQVSSA